MAKLSIRRREDVTPSTAYQAPRDATGVIASVALAPEGYSLWCCDSELADGATIRWAAPHGDDALYVVSGALEVDGRTCPAGGGIIVESDVETIATAIGPTHLVHLGSTDPTPPAGGLFGAPRPDGHGVHVFGPNGAFHSGQLEDVHAVWFADATCDTCRAQLFTVQGPPNHEPRGRSHTHTADEIIYVLDGTISLGAYHLGPGAALCVPGNIRYAVVGGPEGHTFLNFRGDVSEQVWARGTEPVLETALARGGVAVDDVR